MGKERTTPRVVCVALPISRAAGRVLVVSSRKRADKWVLPKGGWEETDTTLEAAASREALEEAGCHGKITRFIVTLSTTNVIYHFFELDVSRLDENWLESHERTREWVDYTEALRRVTWKPELAQALSMSTLAPPKRR